MNQMEPGVPLDPTDSRRQLSTLAPSVKVAETPEGKTMDFGYCVVRMGV